jgi:hypothetical protein
MAYLTKSLLDAGIEYNVPIKQDKNFEKLNEPDIIKNSKLSGKKVHKNG